MPEGDEILVATNPLNSGVAALWRVSASDGRSARVPFVGEDGIMPAVSQARRGEAARLVYVRSFTDDNIWRIDFADPGSITIEFLAKVPGPEMTLGQSKMVFNYEDSFTMANALEGYERLILLAMIGDQSLFTRSDGIERLWEISTPLLENPPPAEPYEPGSWGPASADRLIEPYRWHLPET